MAGESPSGNPLKVLSDNLTWILPLVAVEQFVGSYFAAPYSDWRVGLALVALSLILNSLTGGWGRIREYLANLPRIKFVRPVKPAPIDLHEDAIKRQKLKQIRQHASDLVERFLLPSHDSADKALRAIVGKLPPSPLLNDLVRAYEIVIADEGVALGDLNTMAHRSLQDAPEEAKPTVSILTETLSKTAARHFRLCRLVDKVRLHSAVLLSPPPEIGAWKDAVERLKDRLRLLAEMDGFIEVTRLRSELHSSAIPTNAPKVVPARYGHEQSQQASAEGIFVENIGAPARNIAMQSFRLGPRVVSFSGPEVPQLKREDGARFWEVDVEWPMNCHQTDLFDPFRQWQQEQGDTSLETVGVITYEDFDGSRYETHYRIGIDVLNQDGGMAVAFLEQRML